MLDSLQHLLFIIEEGSFTAAARRAHLTQPALSASIRRLEEAMGARLLRRHARGASATAAGEALLPHARAALASVAAGRRAVAEVEGLAAGQVRIGCGATAATWLLPPVLTAFHQAHPRIALRVREMPTPAIRAAVVAGELDLGIALDRESDDGLVSEVWRVDPLVLVATPALAASLRWQDGRLAPGTPAVAFTVGTALRGLLDRHLPDVEVAMELASIASVLGHLRAGLGVALLSRVAVQADLDQGTLVPLADPRLPPPRQLLLVHGGLEHLPPAGRALRQALREAPPGS